MLSRKEKQARATALGDARERERADNASLAMDAAFEKFRQDFFRNQPYPVEAYTYFCCGWKAARSQ